ncbi:unnamed protein product [Caenorhabditis auriculariae]|uniref:Uncharacterized protein n=1 Tax=Caenorhabditis auriculariae TaxID=2777116 RepID=A0A8S1HS61_9PELO|nr:unnamed protein product [Caenorhabditis auriculariae]
MIRKKTRRSDGSSKRKKKKKKKNRVVSSHQQQQKQKKKKKKKKQIFPVPRLIRLGSRPNLPIEPTICLKRLECVQRGPGNHLRKNAGGGGPKTREIALERVETQAFAMQISDGRRRRFCKSLTDRSGLRK